LFEFRHHTINLYNFVYVKEYIINNNIIEYNTLEMRLFGNDEVNSISLRELYKSLYRGKDFSTFKAKIVDNFDESLDYVLSDESADIIVTLDTAKSLTMIAMTPKGNATRKYFIEVEKKVRKELQLRL
jgi:phage anti-repressor protein